MSLRKRDTSFTHIILWACILFIITAIIWANYAILDEVTTGEGKVIPSRQIQVIQSLEGGIIEQIDVKEGQIVEKDQKLVQIDNTIFLSTYKEELKKIVVLEIEVLRLNAEYKDIPFVVPEKLAKENPEFVGAERALYNSRKEQMTQLELALKLIEKELKLTEPLVGRGAVSEVEVLRLKRTLNETKGKIHEFRSKSLERLNKARGELNALKESSIAEQDRVSRTTVRSPVRGIIKQIKVTTIGGVVKPGMDIIEIVPLDDTLLIEAKIRPQDIGFIHPDQKAMVKISAYDFSIYGGLEGKVEQISADTIKEEVNGKEESFYVIEVRTMKNHLGTDEDPLPIIPGMMASVDILTGEKSVLDYILKPILKAKNTAMRER